MGSRRDFLKQGSAVAGAIALGGTLKTAGASIPEFQQRAASAPMDAAIKELLLESLNAASGLIDFRSLVVRSIRAMKPSCDSA